MWKKLKAKWKIVFGAVGLGLFGGFCVWAVGNIGSEIEQNRDLINLTLIGDSGIQSSQFLSNNEKLRNLAPTDVVILGDESYENGIQSQKDFDQNVKPLSNGFSKFWLVRGNHSWYGHNPAFVEKVLDATPDFRMPSGIVYRNACILLVESTLWEEVINKTDEIEKLKADTEKYIDLWMVKCRYKKRIVGAHHCIYGKSGSHKGFKTKGYKSLYDRKLANKVDNFFCGHNHVVENNGVHEGVQHYTSGAFAKDDTCKSEQCRESGFVTLNIPSGEIVMED
jgi:hypothetical protein